MYKPWKVLGVFVVSYKASTVIDSLPMVTLYGLYLSSFMLEFYQDCEVGGRASGLKIWPVRLAAA